MPAIGWSEASVYAGDSVQYMLPLLGPGYISITLCWDRYTDPSDVDTYNYADSFFPYAETFGPMNDLNLFLETQAGAIIDSSVTTAQNVEHIFFNLPGSGAYKIVVTNNGGLGSHPNQPYGLAWWWGNAAPATGPGDFNSDGKVDGADYVVWRKDSAGHGGAGGYTEWRTNFGNTYGSGSGTSLASVPEPSALLLFSIAVVFGAAKRRRKRARGGRPSVAAARLTLPSGPSIRGLRPRLHSWAAPRPIALA
jgi:PEP-CTERM motif